MATRLSAGWSLFWPYYIHGGSRFGHPYLHGMSLFWPPVYPRGGLSFCHTISVGGFSFGHLYIHRISFFWPSYNRGGSLFWPPVYPWGGLSFGHPSIRRVVSLLTTHVSAGWSLFLPYYIHWGFLFWPPVHPREVSFGCHITVGVPLSAARTTKSVARVPPGLLALCTKSQPYKMTPK